MTFHVKAAEDRLVGSIVDAISAAAIPVSMPRSLPETGPPLPDINQTNHSLV